MLALDDAALARICIAATALRRRRRQRWLKDLVERIDPPPRRVMRELPRHPKNRVAEKPNSRALMPKAKGAKGQSRRTQC